MGTNNELLPITLDQGTAADDGIAFHDGHNVTQVQAHLRHFLRVYGLGDGRLWTLARAAAPSVAKAREPADGILKLSNAYDGVFRSELALETSARNHEARERLTVVLDELRRHKGWSAVMFAAA